jgi:hypothetical protein
MLKKLKKKSSAANKKTVASSVGDVLSPIPSWQLTQKIQPKLWRHWQKKWGRSRLTGPDFGSGPSLMIVWCCYQPERPDEN